MFERLPFRPIKARALKHASGLDEDEDEEKAGASQHICVQVNPSSGGFLSGCLPSPSTVETEVNNTCNKLEASVVRGWGGSIGW